MSTHVEPLINPNQVTEILRDCVFREEELSTPDPKTREDLPEDHVYVEGIMGPFAFHPGRLEEHRAEVSKMLGSLPVEFKKTPGGGWSFLNGCVDRNGTLWTGMQPTVGDLLVLGIGLGLAGYAMPRDLWVALPGGMPYFWVADECYEENPNDAG